MPPGVEGGRKALSQVTMSGTLHRFCMVSWNGLMKPLWGYPRHHFNGEIPPPPPHRGMHLKTPWKFLSFLTVRFWIDGWLYPSVNLDGLLCG